MQNPPTVAAKRNPGLWCAMAHALCLVLTALSADALAGGGTDTADRTETLQRGKAIAVANCSVCHAVGLDDESPARANADTPFRRLHERYPIQMLTEAAKTGSLSGHDEMPGFDFSLEEIEALLAYIDSLAPGKPGYAIGSSGR